MSIRGRLGLVAAAAAGGYAAGRAVGSGQLRDAQMAGSSIVAPAAAGRVGAPPSRGAT